MTKCYAKVLGDCSPKISREHYISKSLLELSVDSDNKVMIDGLLSENGLRINPKNAAVANILCEKHNRLLSDYDATFSKLVKDLMDFNRCPEDKKIEVNGKKITLWLIKTLLGRVAAQRNEEEMHLDKSQFNYLVNVLFLELEFNDCLGFIMVEEDPPNETKGTEGFPPWAISIQRSNGHLIGIKAWTYPFSFTFMLPGIVSSGLRPLGCSFKVLDSTPRELQFRIAW